MDDTIEIAHQEIKKVIKKQEGKNEYCSVGIIDSCSARINTTSGHSKRFDGNKKRKGLKHYVLVITSIHSIVLLHL